jgi:hypothetical protein
MPRTSVIRRGLAALGWLLACGSAFASFGAHYHGTNRERDEFRLYLDGGEFLGRSGSFQSIRVTVHQLRKDRLVRKGEDCVYRFDAQEPGRNRIECAERMPGPLGGVVYVRDTARGPAAADEAEPMVCVRRCGPRVPQRLLLEAEGDNH